MIHVENLTKYFGPVLAVNNVSFQVEKNEIVGLLGNNGAGKTTIMRILTTYLPASSGIARVAGFDVMTQSMEVRQRIGYLPESIPLYPRDARRGVPDLPRQAQGRRSPATRRAHRLLPGALPGRARCAAGWLGTLSKGYRQRVGLADAMLDDPPILILDEPTDGLDPGQKAETLGMLRELGRDHTIMLSSHLLSEVESLVQRVIIIRRGHLGLAKKLAELESDDVIVVEVRGPSDQVAAALRNTEGVAQVTSRGRRATASVSSRCGRISARTCASRFRSVWPRTVGRCGGSTCGAAVCKTAGTRSTTWMNSRPPSRVHEAAPP